ncbi:MAG: glycosyltransferase family 2 protein [Tabrizicola sp.]
MGLVAVIITARNAEATIGDAVASALDQPEVAEVVVVDDASTDATSDAARAAAGDDARLILLRQSTNIGPAAARNLAIASSSAPYIAILDADDYFLPGRFWPLFVETDWDLIADNIVFVPAETPGRVDAKNLPRDKGVSEPLDLAAFVRGNIAEKNVKRGELGFLKPVIRRSILPTEGPVYDPGLWLGEDYDLYVRLLLAGARFRLSRRIGYAARVRPNSLSGRHRTGDLHALMLASARHASAAAHDPAAAAAMRDHHRQLRARYLLRAFLDRKAERGPGPALAFALFPPTNLLPIALGILADKMGAARQPKETAPVGLRTLLQVHEPTGTETEVLETSAASRAVWSDGSSPAAHAPALSSAMQDKR